MTSPQVIVSSLVGVAVVITAMRFLAYPFSDECIQQCVVRQDGVLYGIYAGHFKQFGSLIDGTLCTLFAFFNNICRTLLGKGIGASFASVLFSAQAVAFIDGAQKGKSHVAFVILVVAIGQLVTIGISMNALWLPYFAYNLESEVNNNNNVGASPKTFTRYITICLMLCLPVMLPTFFVTTTHSLWIQANLLFQLFPFVLLPLLWGAAPTQTQNRSNLRPYIVFLRVLSVIVVFVWWLGIVQAIADFGLPSYEESASMKGELLSPIFIDSFGLPVTLRIRPDLLLELNEGAKFLIADLASVVLCMLSAIYSNQQKGKSVRNFSSITFAFKIVALGPGSAIASYWADSYESQQQKVAKSKSV